jgi:hypothetical protein
MDEMGIDRKQDCPCFLTAALNFLAVIFETGAPFTFLAFPLLAASRFAGDYVRRCTVLKGQLRLLLAVLHGGLSMRTLQLGRILGE